MFTVFLQGEYAGTCFSNPLIRFNVDGKMYPREEMEIFDDERFINQTLDALNINNSLLTYVGTDLRTALQPFSLLYKSDTNRFLTSELSAFHSAIEKIS